MSVLIKGAKPPGGCAWCYFNEDTKCALIVGGDYDESNGEKRRTNCPLIELPDHGDLIDRDVAYNHALRIWLRNSNGNDAMEEMLNKLREGFPVVIPAERSEDPSHPFADSVMMGERSEE